MTTNINSALKVDTVGVFFDANLLQTAVEKLKEAGITDSQLGILCSESSLNAKLGHLYQRINRDADDSETPDIDFVQEEAVGDTPYAAFGALSLVAGALGGGALVTSAGVLGGALAVATAVSAVVGGLGALTAGIMSKSDAEELQEQIDAGHILLFVRTGEDRQKDQVSDIIEQVSEIAPRQLKHETIIS